jgi:DNA-binding protein
MLHDKIRTLRELRHWSQEEMAERIHMSKNGYAKIERGESKPNLDRLTQIAQAFDMDLVELINISEKGLVCLFAEKSNSVNGVNYGNYYQGAETIAAENEKLQLIIAHKDELLKQKENELIALRTLVAVLQKGK